MRVLRTAGDIKVDAGGRGSLGGGLGDKDDGPYSLGHNEFILVGCNAQATLKNGSITMSSCSSMCVDGDEPSRLGRSSSGFLSPCSGLGCCQAPIVVANHAAVAGNKLASITSYEVELNYFGSNRTADHRSDDLKHFGKVQIKYVFSIYVTQV